MKSDWEQHLEKIDHRQQTINRIIRWGILCILVGLIAFQAIELIPEAIPVATQEVYPQADNIFYVDSNVENECDGKTWAGAVDTLEEAIDLSKNGDIIYIAQDHSETYVTKGIDVDKAGITIIGLGYGENRPEFKIKRDEFMISNDNIVIHNLRFQQ